MPVSNDVEKKLDALAEEQARLAAAIEGLDEKLEALAEQVRNVAELSTRLKLMSGNAKERALGSANRLDALEKRLARLEASSKR